MAIERGETTAGNGAKAVKAHKFLGSLKDALMAAGREDTAPVAPPAASAPVAVTPQPQSATNDDKGEPPRQKLRTRRWRRPRRSKTCRRRRASCGPS